MSYVYNFTKKQLILIGILSLLFLLLLFLIGYFVGHVGVNKTSLPPPTNKDEKFSNEVKKNEEVKNEESVRIRNENNDILNRDLTFQDILKIKRDIEKKQKMEEDRNINESSEKEYPDSNKEAQRDYYKDRQNNYQDKIPKVISNNEYLQKEYQKEEISQNALYGAQIGAFIDKEKAMLLQKKLKISGYPSYILKKVAEDDVLWHRVIVGNYKDREEARRVAIALEEEGYEVYITSDLR